jgi:RND family efflux transporter MFP subunit
MNRGPSFLVSLIRVLVGLLAAACLSAALVACSSQSSSDRSQPATAAADAPPTVAVVVAQRGELDRTVSIPSEFRPFQQIGVYAKVAGYVRHIYVDVGDHVKTGQLLATLEVPELTDELERAQASKQASAEQVKRAQDELQRSKSAYEVAHLEYTRLAQVMKTRPNLVAQQDVDNAMGADQEASARVAANEAALSSAKSQFTADKAAEDKVKAMIGYTFMTAPFSGVITQRFADTGAMLQAGVSSHVQAMPLVTLAEDDLFRLVIPVPEPDAPKVRLGEIVRVQVPALNRQFQGKVSRFAQDLNFETRTMHTEVDVHNIHGLLYPGLYAEAVLVLDRAPNAVIVPLTALHNDNGTRSLLVVDSSNRLRRRLVKVGLQTTTRAQIVSGVMAGDRVVVAAPASAREGQIVQTQPAAAEPINSSS